MTDMTSNMPYWAIPALATCAIWVALMLWPTERRGGDYDFSGGITGMIQFFAGVSLTLVIWLIYFIIV